MLPLLARLPITTLVSQYLLAPELKFTVSNVFYIYFYTSKLKTGRNYLTSETSIIFKSTMYFKSLNSIIDIL